MSAALILCALHHCAKPSTAADISDVATQLALDADYPKAASAINAKTTAALLKRMEKDGDVRRNGTARTEGSDRPLWEPVRGFRPEPATPAYEGPERDPLPIETMTRLQQLAVFGVLDCTMFELQQQRRELRDLFDQQDRRLGKLVEKTRAQLAANGLGAA